MAALSRVVCKEGSVFMVKCFSFLGFTERAWLLTVCAPIYLHSVTFHCSEALPEYFSSVCFQTKEKQ